ncbi:unnamed protein product [Cyclocybe aegerita]|uniref:Uncharacterized protein n=1 Tax=Cyclocybe aegerita TaxID=1973307 RepID=A0A8S0WM74_CYCAE|nr:unnamed protein product [Cyclocybe aegerita]
MSAFHVSVYDFNIDHTRTSSFQTISSSPKPSSGPTSSLTRTICSAVGATSTKSRTRAVGNAPEPAGSETPSMSASTASSSQSATLSQPSHSAPTQVAGPPAPIPAPGNGDMSSDSSSTTRTASSEPSTPPASATTRADATPSVPPSSTATPPRATSQSTAQNTAPPATSIRPALTTTSLTLVRATNPARTSTVTTHPDTTLSSPVVLTSTDSNGIDFLTTPPLVTILSTSTEPDGGLVTITQVVANPGFNDGQRVTSEAGGILHNQGALAGIFVAVGLAIAAIIGGIIFLVCRRRRKNRRLRWLVGMRQQQPPSPSVDPFQDPYDSYSQTSPQMRTAGNAQDAVSMEHRSVSPAIDAPIMTHNRRSLRNGGASEPHPQHLGNGLQHLDNVDLDLLVRSPFRNSFAPSTPSLYPASLPPVNDDHDGQGDLSKPVAPVTSVPPRPPRSHLRESAKIVDYAPPTPPASISSQSNSMPPSPISEVRPQEARPQDIFTRRTLLDVRARAIT